MLGSASPGRCWLRRRCGPHSKLLAALADPNRGFDDAVVVVGEPQRAFFGNQFGNTYLLFEHYGVPLWIPEVGGRSTCTTRPTT